MHLEPNPWPKPEAVYCYIRGGSPRNLKTVRLDNSSGRSMVYDTARVYAGGRPVNANIHNRCPYGSEMPARGTSMRAKITGFFSKYNGIETQGPCGPPLLLRWFQPGCPHRHGLYPSGGCPARWTGSGGRADTETGGEGVSSDVGVMWDEGRPGGTLPLPGGRIKAGNNKRAEHIFRR